MQEKSPYTIFKEWLCDPRETELDEKTIKALNPLTVIRMFGKLGKLTTYLDNNFNNFYTMKLDHMEFYKELKQLVLANNVGKYQFTFFRFHKMDKEIRKIRKIFPYLKEYEIDMYLNYLKYTPDCEQYLESLGLTTLPKVVKVKKKDLKEIEKKIEDIKKDKLKKHSTKICTFTELKISLGETS